MPERKTPDAASEQPRQGRTTTYPFAAIEATWRERWEQQKLYQVDLTHAKRPYYNLMMFPYPSAEGLHVGNMYSYVGSDIQGRWRAMQGYDVFEPMGFDAFGIHSENFAIQRGIHPRTLTARNVERFRKQLQLVGNRFDWSHEVQTTDPAYYRWTQWIFLQLFKNGLAERKTAPVNWCPKDKTVLADEQVIDGRCERCGTLVERRWLKQWFLKITAYAQRMLDNLEHLDWSRRVIALQRNWIGRSDGLEFTMQVAQQPDLHFPVYSTRPDTIFGMTFVALSPQHPLIERITTPEQREAVRLYQESVNRLRTESEQAMTGVFTGAYAVHPLTNERIPIWIADFVLEGYGAGAVMGVPAHDERDWAFAHALGVPVRVVVLPPGTEAPAELHEAYTGPGMLVNSGDYSGMSSEQASAALAAWFEQRASGKRVTRYRLRDWLISRQRYWGPPIPIIYCPEHGAVPVPEDQLPVLLPDVEQWMPTGTGISPLAAVADFVNTTCPLCGGPATRETDVSDNFLDSAWYFLRYLSNTDETQPWDPELARKWLPVSMYIGGAEHSVLHLMYARFITMALHDLGYLEFEEPFTHFRANGTITKDGAKISKSKGNIINPDDYIERVGADVFRTYLMFMGPYEGGGDFTDRGMGGVVRFLDRVWTLFIRALERGVSKQALSEEAQRGLHRVIKQVTEDVSVVKYNTAVAALMGYLNGLESRKAVTRAELTTFLQLLAPFAPFITEELWARLGQPGSIHTLPWPTFDETIVQSGAYTLAIQVNGRLRASLELEHETPEEEIRRQVLELPQMQRYVGEQKVARIIYVPGRLMNIVTE